MQTIILTLNNNEKKEYIKGIKVREVIENLEKENVVAVKYNNNYVDLEETLQKSGKLSFYDLNTIEGNKIYERGLLYLFELSALEVLGSDTKIVVKYSIDKGIYCKVDKIVTEDNLDKIKKIMKEKVKLGLPFTKIETTKNEAIAYFKSINATRSEVIEYSDSLK